ncbi:MAG: NAD(P)H-hydrate dehydratase [Candidatus Villigracilaceae bacterium]
MKLVSVTEMRAIEQQADASGLSYAQMMENAGRGLANLLLDFLASRGDDLDVLGLVGPGNNGGDTLVALSLLASNGWRARAYLLNREAVDDSLVERLKQAGGEIVLAKQDSRFESLTTFVETADIILDGVLGTGVRLPLKGDVARALDAAKTAIAAAAKPPLVVAVDCPSGVDCDSGEVAEECIPADLTVTMAAVKQGLLRMPAFEYVGEIKVVDIGLSETLPAWNAIQNRVTTAEDVAMLLPDRPLDAHKGTFGTALIVAGSLNYTGAALLAGKAAYRSGAGLVTLAVPAPLHSALAGHLPEATWLLLPHEQGVIAEDAASVVFENLGRVTALLIGPGFGLEETTQKFLEALLDGKFAVRKSSARIGFLHTESDRAEEKRVTLPPLVCDADGLRLLAKISKWPTRLPAPAVLTPHPGEMSALTGLKIEEIQQDRLGVARRFAGEWGHVVVLKGAFTVVAAPDGRTATLPVASPALARAGSGDVLAGLITGLRAQGVEAYEAAVAGAWIHARAGLAAAEFQGGTASILAGDVLEMIADVMAEVHV